jgi:hypothetical protein
MLGWDEDGEVVELAEWQADAVLQLAGPGDGEIRITRPRNGITWGEVIATAARLMKDGCSDLGAPGAKHRACTTVSDMPCLKNIAGMTAWYCSRA